MLLAFIGDRWLHLTDATGRRRIDDPQDWVVQEISVALSRGVRVIPVLVEGAMMPESAQLPVSLQPLVNRQALPLRHSSFSADLARLIAGIEHAGADRLHDAENPAVSGPGEDGPDQFADRWDTRTPRADPRPPITITVPGGAPRHTRLIIGSAIISLAALIGVAVAVVGPFQPAAAPPVSPTPSRTSRAGTATTTLKPATNVTQLQARIPATFRRTCRKIAPESEILRASLLVALQCQPSDGERAGRQPEYSFYFQYADPAAAAAAYRGYYASVGLDPSDCKTGPGEGAYARRGGAGTLRCYTDPNDYQVFAWTDDDLGILSSAADRTMAYAELEQWWEQAGPLR